MNWADIYGIGGHARSVAFLLQSTGWTVNGYFHPDGSGRELLLGKIPYLGDTPSSTYKLILAIGDNTVRAQLFELYIDKLVPEVISHPTACIAQNDRFGSANLVFAFAYLGPEVILGNNNIINTRATLEHEVKVGNHCHISIGALLAGRVVIGDRCFIGAGAVIKDKIKICSDVTIGAGAVVVKDICEPGVYVGNPLKRLR